MHRVHLWGRQESCSMWTQTFIPQSNISFWQPGRQAQLIDVKAQIIGRLSWFCCQSHTGHHVSASSLLLRECRRGDRGRHKLGNGTEDQCYGPDKVHVWQELRKEIRRQKHLLKFFWSSWVEQRTQTVDLLDWRLRFQFMTNGIWRILLEIRLKFCTFFYRHGNHLPCVSSRGNCLEISAIFQAETVLKVLETARTKSVTDSVVTALQAACCRYQRPLRAFAVAGMWPGGPRTSTCSTSSLTLQRSKP